MDNKKKTLFRLLKEETRDRASRFHHLLSRRTIPLNVPSTIRSPNFSDVSPLHPRNPEMWWSRSPPYTPSNPFVSRCIFSLQDYGDIHSIAVSKDLVFTSSSTSHIRAWQLLDCSEKGYIQSTSCKIQAMLAHGELLFSSHKDYKIRVWSIRDSNANFNPIKIKTLPNSSSNRFNLNLCLSSSVTIPQHKDTISCMAYNHDDGILYTGSWDKTVKSWRLSDGICVDSFVAHSNNINDMVIDREGFLVTCSSDGTIKMWSRVCGETYHTLTITLSFHSIPIYALALNEDKSTNRSFLYSGSSDGSINYWGQHFSDRYSHGGSIKAHQFAVLRLVTLENLVISGSEDSMIKIWKRCGEVEKVYYDCVGVLEGHKGPVKCLGTCLEKDRNGGGFLVFSASADETFKIWRIKAIKEMTTSSFDCGNDVDEEEM